MKCACCKKAITGSYIKSGKEFYHPEHFLCSFCGKPIGTDSIRHKKRNYHADCFYNNIALKCSICGKPLTGKYIKDFWGNNYHTEHTMKIPQCSYCKRFVSEKLTGGMRKYDDGRIVCNICFRSAVTDLKDAGIRLGEVREILGKYGIKTEPETFKLLLVNKAGLKKISGKSIIEEQTGYTYCRKRTVNKSTESVELKIYILTGLPEMHFTMTAAHELMHVWQYLNAPFGNNHILCEGSCNFAASLVLKNYKCKESDYLLNNMLSSRDRAYGRGFKRIAAFVKKNSIKAWLDYLKKNKNMPSGY
jgi:hypothetical protein